MIQLVKVAIDVLVLMLSGVPLVGLAAGNDQTLSNGVFNKTELLPETLAARAGTVPDKASRAT